MTRSFTQAVQPRTWVSPEQASACGRGGGAQVARRRGVQRVWRARVNHARLARPAPAGRSERRPLRQGRTAGSHRSIAHGQDAP
eukprot:13201053-Alexandrium_andersonii.AAC.1